MNDQKEPKSIWQAAIKTVASNLNTSETAGLTQNEAEKRLAANGLNVLPTAKRLKWWKVVISHFTEPFMIVLFVLLFIVAFLQQWPELVVIVSIIIIDVTLSTYQEMKAEASTETLKKLIKHQTIVIRDHKKQLINVSDLVIGDLVVLEAGMVVPADLRIIAAYNLTTNEANLTGESEPATKSNRAIAKKDLVVAERHNLAYMSTMISNGSGMAIVYATGINTEIGNISRLIQTVPAKKSRLRTEVMNIIRFVSIIAVVLAIIVFLIEKFVNKTSWNVSLIYAIALVVAVIPEGLAVIITASLALASNRMAKKNAIVKQLNAVETLGQIDIICSDKTGTLTQNVMTVTHYYLHDEFINANQKAVVNQQTIMFFNSLILANNGVYTANKLVGDPTETSLLTFAFQQLNSLKEIKKTFSRVHEYSFDSVRKIMSTVNINQVDKQQFLFVKGAAEKLLTICSKKAYGNEIKPLTNNDQKQIDNVINNMSRQALRVLAVAYKPLSEFDPQDSSQEVEQDLIFLGLVGIIDPPREEVKKALAMTQSAGIMTKMITGDHENTAFAIAQDLNIANNINQVINGQTIAKLSESELKQQIDQYQVFARVAPEQKVTIVAALQSHNHSVAMTGDGVNDAASLKKANIGIAMGETGTDVSKDAADLILTDDNFSTIVKAIDEGRNIYQKLKKIIFFILVTNFMEVLTIIISSALGYSDLLTPIQVLWINLIVESVLAICLSLGPNDSLLMKKKPLNAKARLLSKIWLPIICFSLILSALIFLAYFFLPETKIFANLEKNDFIFIIIVNMPIFYALSFATTSNKFIFSKEMFKNKFILAAILISLMLNALIIFTPIINNIFNIKTNFSFIAYLVCLLISFVPTLLFESFKLFKFIYHYSKNKITKIN